MSPDLMSVEDNRVADEGMIHYFLKETVMHTCTVILAAPPYYWNVI